MKGCFGRIITLVVLVGLGYAAWRWGPEYYPQLQERFGWGTPELSSEPSSELAVQSMDRVFEFLDGPEGERISFGNIEVLSVLLFERPDLVPEGVIGPELRLQEDRVFANAELVKAAFPQIATIPFAGSLLPDTVSIEVEGSLIPLDAGSGALVVHSVQLGPITLPEALIPEVLNSLGRQNYPNLPGEGMQVPYPIGVSNAFILGDSLVLVAGGR